MGLLSSLAPHMLQLWTHPREAGVGGPSWDGKVQNPSRIWTGQILQDLCCLLAPSEASCSHHSPARHPAGFTLLPPACIPGAGEELPWNSRGWLMCKVLETSAALCCHALNLFMKCSSLSAYVQRLGSHRLRSVQSEAKSLKINMGTSLENTATAPNFDCRPFPSPLDSEVMK